MQLPSIIQLPHVPCTPYDRPVFPSNDDIVGAELDWKYEADRCLYWKEHGGNKANKAQYKQKTDSQYRPVGCWVSTNGQKSRIVINDYNPFKGFIDEDAEDHDEDEEDDEGEQDSDEADLKFGFL